MNLKRKKEDERVSSKTERAVNNNTTTSIKRTVQGGWVQIGLPEKVTSVRHLRVSPSNNSVLVVEFKVALVFTVVIHQSNYYNLLLFDKSQ